MKQFLVPISLLFLALSLLAVLVRNAVLDTPAVRMKTFAEERETHVERTVWRPTPEQQQLLDEAARTHPDPISDDLVPVLAALPKQHRDLVFFGKTESDFYLAARSWALRDGYVTGDQREVDMFLDILREPNPDDGPSSPSRNAGPRDYAFVAITNAIIAGDAHRNRFPEFEDAALAHFDTEQHDHAIRVLYQLSQMDALSEKGRRTLEEWMEKRPWLRERLARAVASSKETYYTKD